MAGRLSSILAFYLVVPIVATAGSAKWCHSTFTEVKALAALPTDIRAALKTDAPGLGGVAEHGAPFNATDALIGPYPMRRLIAAGFDSRHWLVALEHGGIASLIEIYMFDGGRQVRLWGSDSEVHTLYDAVKIARKECR
jgi:hypothetical protein